MIQSWTPPADSSGYLWLMQAWTLSVEFFFYLLFPALLLGFRRLRIFGLTIAMIAVCAIIVAFGTPSITPDSPPIPVLGSQTQILIPLLRLPEFLLGIILCRLSYTTKAESTPSMVAVCLQGAAIIAIAIGLATLVNLQAKAIVTLLFGALVVTLSWNNNGLFSKALGSRPLALLGGASYAIYLIQNPVRSFSSVVIASPLDKFASPAITVAVAIGVFLFWEQPARRFIQSRLTGVGGQQTRRHFTAWLQKARG